jgi:hypothetical protein
MLRKLPATNLPACTVSAFESDSKLIWIQIKAFVITYSASQ